MSVVVLALLGGLWASILAPRALRAWRQARPMVSVDSFERRMSVLSSARSTRPAERRDMLAPARPTDSGPAARQARVAARRRTVLATLAVATVNLAAAALLFGGALWVPFALAVLALGGYVALLARLQARRMEARRTVRRLDRGPARPVARGHARPAAPGRARPAPAGYPAVDAVDAQTA